MSAVLIIYL